MNVIELQQRLDVEADGDFGPISRAAFLAAVTNTHAPALTPQDIKKVANDLGVGENIIRAVRTVEAPRGAFDDNGRPSILYEKHIFGRLTKYKFNKSHPTLSSSKWQPGTYGPFSAQYNKLLAALALDPDAALGACSWGAFQVLGMHAESLGYIDALNMAMTLRKSEYEHLDCFARFIKVNKLVDELRQCRAGDPQSCVPFVSKYNGAGYKKNNYHIKFAEAALD